jgi:hypothetical protein
VTAALEAASQRGLPGGNKPRSTREVRAPPVTV